MTANNFSIMNPNTAGKQTKTKGYIPKERVTITTKKQRESIPSSVATVPS